MKDKVWYRLMSTSFLLGVFVFTSCSSDSTFEGPQVQPEPNVPVIHFKAQIKVKEDGDYHSKLVNSDDSGVGPRRIIKTPNENENVLDTDWKSGEKVALIYNVGGAKYKATATITSVSNGIATIEAAITEGSPENGTSIKLVYPAAAADETQENGLKTNYLQEGQDGTTETISARYDVVVGDGVFVVAETGGQLNGSLKERVAMANQYAILRLSFISGDVPVEGMNYLRIANETDDKVLTTVRCSDLNSVYVALEPINTAKTVRITAVNSIATYSSTAKLNKIDPSMYYKSTLKLNAVGPRTVDLSLPSGTLWATCNIGASAPEEYGDFFAWGETTGYTSAYSYYMDDHDFSWANYFDTSDQGSTFNKYSLNNGKTVLEAEDDAATTNWGDSWKMPTENMLIELMVTYPANVGSGSRYRAWVDNYNSTGVSGLAFYDAFDNILLFLPAAGFRSSSSLINQGTGGFYRCSTLSDYYSWNTSILFFYSPSSNGKSSISNGLRMTGYSVRPVLAV